MIIDDGTGHGFQAKVDDEYNLHTRSVRTHEVTYATLMAEAFSTVYGAINLTSANESALALALWQETDNPIVIFRQIMSFGPSTGGAGLCRVRVIRNPTGGTLISNGTAITPVNGNFGSSAVPGGTWKKGAEGSTVTGGTNVMDLGIGPNYVLNETDINWILANNNSMAIAITPPPGNTGMNVYLHENFYKVDQKSVL